nr:hypothetical protein [Tanacetum cinerariifolium]
MAVAEYLGQKHTHDFDETAMLLMTDKDDDPGEAATDGGGEFDDRLDEITLDLSQEFVIKVLESRNVSGGSLVGFLKWVYREKNCEVFSVTSRWKSCGSDQAGDKIWENKAKAFGLKKLAYQLKGETTLKEAAYMFKLIGEDECAAPCYREESKITSWLKREQIQKEERTAGESLKQETETKRVMECKVNKGTSGMLDGETTLKEAADMFKLIGEDECAAPCYREESKITSLSKREQIQKEERTAGAKSPNHGGPGAAPVVAGSKGRQPPGRVQEAEPLAGFRNAEEYAYRPKQSMNYIENQIVWESRLKDIKRSKPYAHVFYGPQRNPNESPRYLYNKDLFFLKYGNTKEKSYVLLLHKIHVVLFLEDDLEEKMNRWVRKEFKTFNEEAQLAIPH